VDAGLDKTFAKLSDLTPERYLEAGRAAVQYNHRLGITAWLDPQATTADLQTYRRLAELNELEAHVAAFPEVYPRSETDPLARIQSIRDEYKNIPNLTVPGFKIFADGVVEIPAQTAVMSKPYKNTGLSGELLFDPVLFAALVTAADKQGLIVHVHVIGDRAVHAVLNEVVCEEWPETVSQPVSLFGESAIPNRMDDADSSHHFTTDRPTNRSSGHVDDWIIGKWNLQHLWRSF
jgi:predicted amidohydrolase YtcJ